MLSGSSQRSAQWALLRVAGCRHHSFRSAQRSGISRPQAKGRSSGEPRLVTLEPDGSDAWRLASVIKCLQEGGVAVLPTDSLPALVCDVESKQGVACLCAAKQEALSKPMSILIRGFQDIDTYTSGLPLGSGGQGTDMFRVAKRTLPGPYTLILPASSALPKRILDLQTGKSKKRKTVGIRWPDHFVTQTVLEQLERPLLATSAHVPQEDGLEWPEAAALVDQFVGSGVAFVVDAGVQVSEGSTVIDLTGSEPELVRQGKGDARPFMPDLAAV